MSINKKKLKIIGGILLAAAVIGGIIYFSGYSYAIKKYIRACYKDDAVAVSNFLPQYYTDYMMNTWSWDENDVLDQAEEMADDLYWDMISDCGEDAKVEGIKITKVIKATSTQLKQIKNKLEKDYDFNVNDITAAVWVEIVVDAIGEKAGYYYTLTRAFVKEKGKWKIATSSVYDVLEE